MPRKDRARDLQREMVILRKEIEQDGADHLFWISRKHDSRELVRVMLSDSGLDVRQVSHVRVFLTLVACHLYGRSFPRGTPKRSKLDDLGLLNLTLSVLKEGKNKKSAVAKALLQEDELNGETFGAVRTQLYRAMENLKKGRIKASPRVLKQLSKLESAFEK